MLTKAGRGHRKVPAWREGPQGAIHGEREITSPVMEAQLVRYMVAGLHVDKVLLMVAVFNAHTVLYVIDNSIIAAINIDLPLVHMHDKEVAIGVAVHLQGSPRIYTLSFRNSSETKNVWRDGRSGTNSFDRLRMTRFKSQRSATHVGETS